MDYISREYDFVCENFRTGRSLKNCQGDFWHKDQGLQNPFK